MDVGSVVGSEVRSLFHAVPRLAIKWTFSFIAFFAFLVLSGCSNSSPRGVETFRKTSVQCESTAISKQYVVRWKDGTTVVYKNKSEKEFLDEVVTPNESEIDVAEQDQLVRLTPPEPDSTLRSMAYDESSADWGQRYTQAPSAWAQSQTGTGVVVAVIDSGVQRDHVQLKNQMYVNPGETGLDADGKNKATNGIDDDRNGFIDDVSGYDFYNDSGVVTDGSSHGTHVSGIIAADATKGSIQGIAYGAKILPLDFMNDKGQGRISDAIRAIYYAASMGAKVINASWGGSGCSATLQKAIVDVGALGVLFVSAAGNEGQDLDEVPDYPAGFGLPTQITVGASMLSTTSQARPTPEVMTVFSNYSYTLVNIMAPGHNILSTIPTNRVESNSGTSMAAPFVSAAAAILWSAKPQATPLEIKSALLASVDAGPYQVSSRGRLNIRKALLEIQKLQ